LCAGRKDLKSVISIEVTIKVEAGSKEKADEIEPLFKRLASDANVGDSLKEFMQVVLTILNGSRDKALADDSALYYADAAEVLFLIERLK